MDVVAVVANNSNSMLNRSACPLTLCEHLPKARAHKPELQTLTCTARQGAEFSMHFYILKGLSPPLFCALQNVRQSRTNTNKVFHAQACVGDEPM